MKLLPLPSFADTGYEMRGQAAGAYLSITLRTGFALGKRM